MSKFCINCGQEINEEVSFCVNCGERVNNEDKETTSVKTSNNINKKSKITAGLLAIFLGSFGVHNFYLGYTKKAVAQLLITVLSFGSLSFISSTWSLVEGVMILVGNINEDATGNPLGE